MHKTNLFFFYFLFFFRGNQKIRLRVIKGNPLPIAFDIISATFCYGNRPFTNYPQELTDYFKQAFPEGLSWERSITCEDGGSAAVTADLR